MGVSDINIPFNLPAGEYPEHGDSAKIDGVDSPLINGIIKHTHPYDENELLSKLGRVVEDVINETEFPNAAYEDGGSWYAQCELHHSKDDTSCSIDITYDAEADPELEESDHDIPEEFHREKLPKSFVINYSGAGDSGGIDEIVYDGKVSDQFREYIDNISYDLIPSDANFNNEGSSGNVTCKIKGKKMHVVSAHKDNYRESVKTTTKINIKDIDVEIEV